MTDNTKPEYLIDASAIFNDAFKILNKELNNRITIADNGGNGKGCAIMIPSTVILALSIELGIKALLYKKDNNLTKGHKIDELYSKLDQYRKDRISKYTCSHLKIDDNKFSELFLKNNSTFIDWRYFFEKDNNVDYGFLGHLNDAIQNELLITDDNTEIEIY